MAKLQKPKNANQHLHIVVWLSVGFFCAVIVVAFLTMFYSDPMALFMVVVSGLSIRTIGIKRAEAKTTLANIAYNMKRFVFFERRAIAG